ncbi:helix-turn-helix domain-containing protein [Dyadobacter fermentans]|uniref:Helix-turn-helix domain protein n=1 Tax=Dyadobacter fermentans (strain ATCC 700827 / DSM 18053 / CIP 107007 / KCTC 52180 / NS114) TaxID=471854 RepID=C6W045_DYAFD|nr:XRE family transcriptional regulator [Dyadobacter fermentans]ACT95372.1 helix-turn-helix domain protein [Dyadobacter fermentans DSM 18053]
MDSPFPYRLTTARKMKGLSLQKLAIMLGRPFNKQLLHRLENGSQVPNGNQLIKLSNALDQPLDYFLKPSFATVAELDSKKIQKAGKKAGGRVLELASDYFERFLELEDLLGIKHQTQWPFQSVKLVPGDYAAINQAALHVRQMIWNVGTGPLHNISGILETNGLKVLMVSEESLPEATFDGFSTIVSGEKGCIVVNENPAIPLVRKRFILLREFVNLYIDVSELETKEAKTVCDAFAGALLAPRLSLIEAFGEYRTSIHITELLLFQRIHGAPISVILSALRQNGIISQSHFTEQMVQYNAGLKAHDGGSFAGIEEPYRFQQLLLRALACGIVSESKAASLMNMKVAEFREYLDKMLDENSGH